MRHKGTQTVETERLVLRRFRENDADAMYQNWASDPEVTRWLRWDPHADVNETRALLAEWVARYPQDGEYYCWAAARKGTGELVGSVGILKNGVPGDARQDFPGGWEAGYCYAKSAWGKGYATEAMRATVDWFFENTPETLIHAGHAVANPASGHVLEKCGFVYTGEGEYTRFSGEKVPAKMMELTREAWVRGRGPAWGGTQHCGPAGCAR